MNVEVHILTRYARNLGSEANMGFIKILLLSISRLVKLKVFSDDKIKLQVCASAAVFFWGQLGWCSGEICSWMCSIFVPKGFNVEVAK